MSITFFSFCQSFFSRLEKQQHAFSLRSACLHYLIDVLTFKLRQPLRDLGPTLVAPDDPDYGLDDLVLAGADLRCGVAVAQGDGTVFQGLEVDGDAEGGAELVVAGVSSR